MADQKGNAPGPAQVHIVEMQGESYRLNKSKKRQQKQGGKATQEKNERMGQPPNPLTSVHYGRYSLTQSGSILLACSGSILRACFQETDQDDLHRSGESVAKRIHRKFP